MTRQPLLLLDTERCILKGISEEDEPVFRRVLTYLRESGMIHEQKRLVQLLNEHASFRRQLVHRANSGVPNRVQDAPTPE